MAFDWTGWISIAQVFARSERMGADRDSNGVTDGIRWDPYPGQEQRAADSDAGAGWWLELTRANAIEAGCVSCRTWIVSALSTRRSVARNAGQWKQDDLLAFWL
jgi:hypothetical protein